MLGLGNKCRFSERAANAFIDGATSPVLFLDFLYFVFEGDKSYVQLLTSPEGDEEQTFERREVKIGLSDGINIEITEGVTAEDKVRGARIEKK